MSLSRLADYFVIVGYDHNKTAGNVASGKVIQRFPETDWNKCPFTPGIEPFCQPGGWHLTTHKNAPTFFVSVLTDIDAYKHYCACLSFSEDVVIDSLVKEDDDDDDDDEGTDSGVVRCSKLYAPKCLVLVSRLTCFEVFRNCLGILYATYIDNLNISFESIIATILSGVLVPPHGGPAIKLTLGAGDRQFIQPPSSPSLPVTGTSVALLFEQLGISNTITIFCAALSDHKILLHSLSFSRLTDSSNALTALMYPLKYSYVYIPLLPVALLEVLNAPTPFITGVHSSHKPDNSELTDVVIADLDGGSIRIPENMQIPLMPQPMLDRVKNSLQMVLRPDLNLADMAFSSSSPSLSQPEMLDKEIRAIFLRFFAELFLNYRPCLNLIRIHPEPVIAFHKASFLGNRGLIEDEFSRKVVDSMSFNSFVMERGPPYRVCDLFDDVFDKLQETLASEVGNVCKTLSNIQALANKLYLNEHPDRSSLVQKIPMPTEGSHLRVHQPLFPTLDAVKINSLIQENLAKNAANTNANRNIYSWVQYPRIVPTGTRLTQSQTDKAQLVSTNARRLEVLKSCVIFIFENKISDARKIFPAVLKVLKSKVARLLLVEELAHHVKSNRSLLEHQQFDLVVKLLNSALQNESVMDENGIAAAILPLTTSFCRKLYTGVIQFAYTCVQDHAVWSSQQFWEGSFHQDVQQQVCQLYEEVDAENKNATDNEGGSKDLTPVSAKDTTLKRSDSRRWSSLVLNPPNHYAHQRSITALEIAAEQMRLWPNLSSEEKQEKIKNEESTVYSQAIHYANRMVYLRIPLDVVKNNKDSFEGQSVNSIITNSAADSDSMEGESRSEDIDMNEIGNNVEKFVDKFVEKVCQESGVSTDHVNALKQMVRGVIQMHMETLEAVQQEIARLPPVPKPRIISPVLLVGEEMMMDGLRAYLVPDGREDGSGGSMGGPSHLPAEGAIFLTSYRIVFKGTSCDPLVSEHTICRSFPIASLTKDKRLSSQYLNHKDIWVHEAMQLRSCTFQMIKVAFDEEVVVGEIELLRKMLFKLRHPTHILATFAFTGATFSTNRPITFISKGKDKNVSLKNFAKKTLMRTAKKAGIKTKDYTQGSHRSSRYNSFQKRFDMSCTLPYDPQQNLLYADDRAVIDEHVSKAQLMSEARSLERLAERFYCKDFQRLGLGSLYSSSTHHPIRPRPDQFRLSLINAESSYAICPSYPAVLPVPYLISDDSIQKVCKSHRHNRFPIATWRHASTKALLLRASSFHGKGVIGVLKGHYNNPAASTQVDGVATSVTVEQEKYLSAIISCTPPEVVASTYCLPAEVLKTTAKGKQLLELLEYMSKINLYESIPCNDSSTLTFSRRSSFLGSTLQQASNFSRRRNSTILGKFISSQNPSPHSSFSGQLSPKKQRSFFRNNASSKSTSPTSFTERFFFRRPQSTRGSSATLNNKRLESNLKATPSFLQKPPIHPQTSLNHPTNYSLIHRLQNKMTLKTLTKERRTIGSKQPYPPTNSASKAHCMTIDNNISEYYHNFCKSTLYILGEKTQIKGLRIESLGKCDFVPVELSDVRQVKTSFKKLLRACVPSNNITPQAGGTDQGSGDGKKGGLLRNVQETGWLAQLENIIKVAGLIADLIDLQGSSVMVCLEDGWDFTAQVVSVAQILLDPYYRTIEGFKVLVEKEWLAFGHRFSHRGNHTTANQPSSFAPIFLQFLDVVHQIHMQFPMAFEFNQFYLRFLAYHCHSNRFRTFLLDSEMRRVEVGWMTKDQSSTAPIDPLDQPLGNQMPDFPSQPPFLNHHNSDLSLSSETADTLTSLHHQDHQRAPSSKLSSLSIWDYIEHHHHNSTIFYNFLYGFKDIDSVLRPTSSTSSLHIWDFYLTEDLSTGCPYDIELRDFDLRYHISNAILDSEAVNSNGVNQGNRQVVNSCYDNLEVLQPDSFSHLLMEIYRLESDLNQAPPGGWIEQWQNMEPPADPITSQASISNSYSASSWEEQRRRFMLQQSNQRKLTVEMLYRNKQLNASPAHNSIDEDDEDDHSKRSNFHYQHSFIPHYYTTPSQCNFCTQVLWGLIKSGYHCNDCSYNCHEKCLPLVPNNCTGTKSITDLQFSTHSQSSSHQQHLTASQAHNGPYKDSSNESFLKFSSDSTEHRTYEGYLQKRGVMLKGWKLRYFVLDSVKHQLRYYDNPEDRHCKGYIDLAEVESVSHVKNIPGAPKKNEEGAIFELKTSRRPYHFYASSQKLVNEWVDKIQHCI